MEYQQLLQMLKHDMPSQTLLVPEGYPFWIIVGTCVLFFWAFCLAFFPRYRVWSHRKRGEADLAEANFEQQIQIARAKARLEAAEMNKKASIIEAEAVALSVERIGKSLEHNHGYLKWQWIKMMEETDNATIYVPTETNLPILEAGKRKTPNGEVEEDI